SARKPDTIGGQIVLRSVGAPGKATATLLAQSSRRAGLLGVVALCLIATACQATTSGGQSPSGKGGSSSSDAPASAARVTITPARGSKGADPSAGVSVKVSGGTLTDVSAEAGGRPIAGTQSRGGTSGGRSWALEAGTKA